MVNARLDERANEFAAHLQRIGELIEPGFSLSRQSVAKAAFPAIRLSGDIHVAHLLTIRGQVLVSGVSVFSNHDCHCLVSILIRTGYQTQVKQ